MRLVYSWPHTVPPRGSSEGLLGGLHRVRRYAYTTRTLTLCSFVVGAQRLVTLTGIQVKKQFLAFLATGQHGAADLRIGPDGRLSGRATVATIRERDFWILSARHQAARDGRRHRTLYTLRNS
eukprot:scaffold4231_cov125-Isochrysis_galbana.AAC.2